jgi:transcriptional regulator with XRE-family HTH domain
MHTPLRPEVLRWARERARLDVETLAKRLGTSPARVSSCESDGRIRPKQVDKLARVTHTAVGLLYLPEPPVETLPIRDFRTLRDEEMRTPSPALVDVIDQARQRQDWFRDYLAGTRGRIRSTGWVRSPTCRSGAAAEHGRCNGPRYRAPPIGADLGRRQIALIDSTARW